jgi:hypothetical protein
MHIICHNRGGGGGSFLFLSFYLGSTGPEGASIFKIAEISVELVVYEKYVFILGYLHISELLVLY